MCKKDWKDKMPLYSLYPALRHMKTTGERRANSCPEIKQYVRGARLPNSLPNLYDDIPPCIETSWKRRHKCKKQWMTKWAKLRKRH